MLLSGNEFHVQCEGLVVEVLETTGGGCGRGVEDLGFVVGLAGDDHGPDDAGELVRPGDDALQATSLALHRFFQT